MFKTQYKIPLTVRAIMSTDVIYSLEKTLLSTLICLGESLKVSENPLVPAPDFENCWHRVT